MTELIDQKDPSAFNQGLMDLGAHNLYTYFTKMFTMSSTRILYWLFKKGMQQELPIKTKKTKTKKIQYDVFVAKDEGNVIYLKRRPNEGLLANMWQFPMIERKDQID